MTLEQQYAQALYDLVIQKPEKSNAYLQGLTSTLEKKGHTKLLPQIFARYTQIIEIQERSEAYKKVTPEGERTRVLLELYRTLVSTTSFANNI